MVWRVLVSDDDPRCALTNGDGTCADYQTLGIAQQSWIACGRCGVVRAVVVESAAI